MANQEYKNACRASDALEQHPIGLAESKSSAPRACPRCGSTRCAMLDGVGDGGEASEFDRAVVRWFNEINER